MKAFCIILLICSLPQQITLGIEESYDRFENVSTLRLTQSLKPTQPGYVLFIVTAFGKGERIVVRPATVGIIVVSQTENWTYADSRDFRLILNGKERLFLGTMKRASARVVPSGVLEGINLQIPFVTLERMSKAAKLEMRIGPSEFELTSAQIEYLKEFIKRLPVR